MQSCIFLILGFLQLVFCSSLINVTGDDAPVSVCPFTLFRRKRSNLEYTRWRSNVETTPEFIVKVLDEEMTTSHAKQVVAVNIMPITRRPEKIIVGGAIVPPPLTSPSADILWEYTRFVPPTPAPEMRIEGELYLAPLPSDGYRPVKSEAQFPEGRHALRDESPPASPQFLPRAHGPNAQQFVPIEPVAFAQKHTLKTPFLGYDKIGMRPTRTTLSDIIPLRTDPENFPIFQPFLDEIISNDFFVTLTSQQHIPPQTSEPVTPEALRDDEDILLPTTKLRLESRNHDQDKEMDSDISYHNNMLYNDDYKNGDTRKMGKERENYKEYDLFTKEAVGGTPHTAILESGNQSDIMYFEDTDKPLNESTTLDVTASDEQTDVERIKRRPVCSMLKLRLLNFNSPRTLPEIVTQLKKWAEESPVARWVDITDGNLTTMENPIHMMIVDDPSSGQIISAKQTVMMVAGVGSPGIQGRDHHAVAAALYVLYQLIERSAAHSDLLSKYRFWIIPVFNPDGYDYSMTFPHRREWTKNVRQSWELCKERDSCQHCASYGLRCTIQSCYGVNLDRNFEYQWIPPEELRADHPCGALYAGSRQLSEPETRALTHYLHAMRVPLYSFIAFKEGDVLGVMYPYSHTKKKRSFDHVYKQRASRAAAAAYSISGRPYVAGQTSEFLPLYAGGIEDWVDGHLGIDNTYTIMMFRPSDSYNSKQITERVVHEAYAAMDTLLLQSLGPLSPPIMRMEERSKGDRTLPIHCTLLFVTLPIIF